MSNFTKTFTNPGDFDAMYAAEAWLKERGFSVGRGQAGSPRGILYGDFNIQKWKNLRPSDIAALHGQMVGGRGGPVTVTLFEVVAPIVPELFSGIDAAARNRLHNHDF